MLFFYKYIRKILAHKHELSNVSKRSLLEDQEIEIDLEIDLELEIDKKIDLDIEIVHTKVK